MNHENNYILTSDGELYHYGVLGMKWGKRRAKKYADKAEMHRRFAEDYDPKNALYKMSDKERSKVQRKMDRELRTAEKYDAKSNAVKAKHEKLAGKKTFERVSNASMGKTLAQAYVFGTYGAVKYNQARAAGASRGKAALNAALHQWGNAMTLGALSVVEPRMNDDGKA